MILSTNSPYNLVSYEKEKVHEIYPQFLRDGAKNIIAFLEEYYDYLNQSGFASYELGHLTSQSDIDETSEKYLDAIQNEIAKYVPNSEVIDRNTLYKRIVHFYRIKGTPTSIEKFFALFFDAAAEVYLPSKDLFKPSEGAFTIPNKYWISNGLFYFSDGLTILESDANTGVHIRPTYQPTFGDNFEISLTILLSSTQSTTENSYIFANSVNDSANDYEVFDFVRDYSTYANYLNIRQTARLNAEWETTRVYLTRDIFDDQWHNVSVKYTANNDGIILTPDDTDKIIIEGANNNDVNGIHKFDSGVWKKVIDDSPETLSDSGLYSDKINSATTFDALDLIDGEEYEIAVVGTINWTDIGATSGTQGEVFTYNGVTITGSDGEVYHRTEQWHYRIYDNNSPSSYEIYFRDSQFKNYHISGGQPGGPATSNDDISNIVFIQEDTLVTQQTATVKVIVDGEILCNEKIPNNGGFSGPADVFTILSRNNSITPITNDTLSLLAYVEVKGVISNGFEYRFTEFDKKKINKLTDLSGNNNIGLIRRNALNATLPNFGGQFTLTWPSGFGGDVSGTYNGTSLETENEVYTSIINNHTCEIIIDNGEYYWKITSGIDSNITYESYEKYPSYEKLPRPWYIKNWSPSWPPGAYIKPNIGINTNFLWEDESQTWSPIPSKIQPIPITRYYTNSDGYVSDIKKIQDSNFWQDYSYKITTSVPIKKWEDSFNRLVHPAGMKFFSLLLIEIMSTGTWDEYIDYVGTSENSDSWLFALIPPSRRIINNYNAYHSPKYQPGWLQAIKKIVINLLTELDDTNYIQNDIKQYIIAKQYYYLGEEYSQYYVSNYYQYGTDNINPLFWYDERPLNESGYLPIQINEISNKINPYASIINIS